MMSLQMAEDDSRITQVEKKIGVCFVSPKAYPLFNPDVQGIFGGAEVDLYYIGTELAKDASFDVSFVTADYGQPDGETKENVRIIKSLKFDQRALTGALKVWRAMRKADADIYVMKSEYGVSLVAFFCRIKGRFFVYRTARAAHCDGTYIREHPLAGMIFRRSVKSAKLVLTQNEHDKAGLLGTIGVNAVVVQNGHRISLHTQAEKDIVLWVGRSAPTKRPYKFIQLAREYPSQKFVMICQRATGDENYDKLISVAEGVTNLVFFERVPFNEVGSFFSRAKMLVNTSDIEGFPNTFIQACLVCTPILSLNVNPDGFLDEYKCGICASDDWQKFVSGLKMLLEPDTARQYGEKAFEYVMKNHDVTTIIEQYKKLFRELTAGRKQMTGR
jgi:hypothetical protein